MPEGHTIHRIARDHRRWFVGQQLAACSPQGRFEGGAKRIDSQELIDVDAWGKHLFYHWPNQVVHVHLGLYGKFRMHKSPPPEPRGAVRLRIVGSERSFDLNGPNCCELINPPELDALHNRLGEDPLRDDADPQRLWQRLQKCRSAIGSVLLNQSIIAGVGNIYRCEILFLLGLHPQRLAKELTRKEFDQLWQLTVKLLSIGVKYNRIITAIPEDGKGLGRLKSAERLNIYKHESCPQCGESIESWELANRKIYACSTCQQ